MRYDKLTQAENYYRNLLLLFKPWRNKIEVLVPFASYQASFDQEIQTNEMLAKYEERISIRVKKRQQHEDRVKECVAHIVEEEETNALETVECSEEVLRQVQEEFVQSCDLGSFGELDNVFYSLNKDQKRVFLTVISSLHKQFPGIEVPVLVKGILNENCSSEPLRKFVSGVGGTGKSYLIHAIKSYVSSIFKKRVAIMAPTGIAACQIGGMTIHRLLHMPVQHGDTPDYTSLGDNTLSESRHMLCEVPLFICDEISMVSNLMLVYMHKRLCEIYRKPDDLFGGKNVLFFGDLLQLAPVKNGACFEKLSRSEKKKLKSCAYIQPWNLLTYDELTINVRQKSDMVYAGILDGIRVGFIDEKDETWLLNKCLYQFKTKDEKSRMSELAELVVSKLKDGKDYTVLLPTNDMVRQVNAAILKTIDGTLYSIKAYDSIVIRTQSVSLGNDNKILRKLEKI